MTRRVKVTLIVLGVWSSIAFLAIAVIVGHNMLDLQPFQMTLRPADGHALVQFAQPDQNLCSPEFSVDLLIEEARTVELRSGEIAVPGCRVEFFDTTMLPGTFRLWVGRTYFDLTPGGIIVGGKEYDWQPL